MFFYSLKFVTVQILIQRCETTRAQFDTDGRPLTVHLHEQLIEGVLLLTLSSKVASTTLPSHGINLVNEENAGSILPGKGK